MTAPKKNNLGRAAPKSSSYSGDFRKKSPLFASERRVFGEWGAPVILECANKKYYALENAEKKLVGFCPIDELYLIDEYEKKTGETLWLVRKK